MLCTECRATVLQSIKYYKEIQKIFPLPNYFLCHALTITGNFSQCWETNPQQCGFITQKWKFN